MSTGNLHLVSLYFLFSTLCTQRALGVPISEITTANSTRPRHVHDPDWEEARAADAKIILILGAVVCLTFALGLVSQLCEISIFPCSGKRHWDDDLELNAPAQYHKSPDETGMLVSVSAHASDDVTDSSTNGNMYMAEIPRWTTRYGTITQHIVVVGGFRKLVLVVNPTRDRAQDGYTEWFRRWRQRRDIEASDQPLDTYTPLLASPPP
ncbi:hypothetical protein BJX99DRAFT_115534 [Aspergillus californicus]